MKIMDLKCRDLKRMDFTEYFNRYEFKIHGLSTKHVDVEMAI